MTTAEKEAKILELEAQLKQIQLIQAGIGGLGSVAGWIYANKTGGGFGRYFGFGLLGGLAFGTIGYFTTMQKANKIQLEIDKLKL